MIESQQTPAWSSGDVAEKNKGRRSMRIAGTMLPILFLGISLSAQAAPKLRLTATTLGPVSVTQGGSASQQTIEAYNAGDGNLTLQVASSVPWLTASVAPARVCNVQEGSCIPINIQFQTASLARGVFSGTITVSDPNALDAPQNIVITVQVGGGVPDVANLYVAPNGSVDEVKFSSNSNLSYSATTTSGGPWLNISLDGTGSFRFVFPYRITGRPLEGMGEGSYTGSIVVSGSQVAAENKTIPVRLQVTSQPIARVNVTDAAFRVSSGAPAQQMTIAAFNGGLGTLEVSDATVSTSSGGTWLTVERNGSTITLKADPAGLANGSYAGTLTVVSNAANSNLSIPVRIDVVSPGPPISSVGGVVNSGNFDEGLAPGGVAAMFGEQLSYQAAAQASSVPLETSLGGVRVLVNGVSAPLFYSSYNQVNFQIPFDTAAGEATIQVERDGTVGNRLSLQLQSRAPRIIRLGDNGVVVNAQDGSLAWSGGRATRPGEVITIYMVGLGNTNPVSTTGSAAPAAEPLARISPAPKVILGSAFNGTIVLDPLFVGLTPSLVGLYQVNVQIPVDTPIGDILISVEGDGYRSNTVLLPIKP